MKNKKHIIGLFLIMMVIIGGISSLLNITFSSIKVLWPMFMLVPGLSFEITYFFTRKNPEILVPGGILTTIGILFFFETITSWKFSGVTWPIYIVGVAIGLFQLYLFGGRAKGLKRF